MSEQRSVTLSREQRDAFAYLEEVLQTSMAVPVGQCVAAWDAADPLACPACNGTGLTPSLEGCGTRVQCRACHGTGHAS